jgi:hypothetical protein
MNLFEFLSMGGQERRKMLDNYVDDLNLEQFVPPNLRPVVEMGIETNPIQGAMNAMQASGVVFDPAQTAEARKRAAFDMGAEMAMTLAPTALVRMGYMAAPAGLMETFATPSVDAAVDIGRGLLSDATYAARSVGEGDFGGVLEAFMPGGQPQSLSAGATGLLTPKEQLDPQRLSKVKMPAHVSEIEYKATPTGDLEARRAISIEDLQGTTLIPAYGDRTYGGALLEEIGGTRLNQPVNMQGGHDFMRDQRTGLWASEESAMTPKAKFIDKLISSGEDPRMIYTAMGGQSADFSHHMADATMGLVEQSNITKKAAKEYDDIVKEKLDPNWPGILSPKARDYLHNNMTGTLRRELWQEMDKGKWQKMGFPHLGIARASITDPNLLTVDPFASGLSITKQQNAALVIRQPNWRRIPWWPRATSPRQYDI